MNPTEKEKQLHNEMWQHRDFLKKQIEKKEEELYELQQQLAYYEEEMEEEGLLNPKK